MFKIILTIGSKIKDDLGNEYILDSVIGSGGFATVYKSRRLADNEVFAVKIFSPNLKDTEEKLSFQKEIEQSNIIISENVIKYFYCHNGETFAELPPYIIMEFANQGTLADLIYNQKISGTQFDNSVIIDFFKQLSNGMLEVSKYFVHRDIKPENILIKDGKLKISDFGLSKIATDITHTFTMKGYGSVPYIAPEAWLNKENTIQMDIYSMGIVFYKIATLNYPYDIGKSPDNEDFKELHLYKPIINPHNFNPNLPETLSSVIIKMLEKSPSDRFKNWKQIIKYINEINILNNDATFVKKALKKRNDEDIEIQKEQAKREKDQKNKSDYKKLIFSQYDRKIVSLINTFADEFNKSYPGDKKYYLNKIPYDNQNDYFKFSLNTPSGIMIDIKTQIIFKENFNRKLPNEFYPNKTFYENYTPQCNNINILAWSQLIDSNGKGFNILLLDTENSPYGKWYVLINKNNVFNQKKRPEPFGFNIEELPKEINLISCTHIYDSELKEFDSDKFYDFLANYA